MTALLGAAIHRSPSGTGAVGMAAGSPGLRALPRATDSQTSRFPASVSKALSAPHSVSPPSGTSRAPPQPGRRPMCV